MNIDDMPKGLRSALRKQFPNNNYPVLEQKLSAVAKALEDYLAQRESVQALNGLLFFKSSVCVKPREELIKMGMDESLFRNIFEYFLAARGETLSEAEYFELFSPAPHSGGHE